MIDSFRLRINYYSSAKHSPFFFSNIKKHLVWAEQINSIQTSSSWRINFVVNMFFLFSFCFVCLFMVLHSHSQATHNLYSSVIFFIRLLDGISAYSAVLLRLWATAMIYQSHTQSWSVQVTARGGLTCGLAWHSRKECYSPRKSYYSKVWWISVLQKLICGLTYNLL